MQPYSECPQVLRDFLSYHESIKGQSRRTVSEYHLDLRMFLRFLTLMRKELPYQTPLDEIDIKWIDASVLDTVSSSEVFDFLSYPTIQKQHQNCKIPVFIRPIDSLQERGRFFQCQVFWQTAPDFRKFDIFDRIVLDLLGADGQILIECLNGRQLPRAGSGRDPDISRAFTVLPVVCKIR